MSREEDRKKRKKKQDDWLMAQVMAIMQKAMRAALDQAIDDILGSWK